MDEKQKFALSEAKDYLAGTISGIDKTRNKCWQLVSFVLAINFYFIQKVILENEIKSFTAYTLIAIWFIVGMILVRLLRSSLQPSAIMLNGDSAKNLKTILEDQSLDFFTECLYNYESSTKKNKIALSRLAGNYNMAFDVVASAIVVSLIAYLFGLAVS